VPWVHAKLLRDAGMCMHVQSHTPAAVVGPQPASECLGAYSSTCASEGVIVHVLCALLSRAAVQVRCHCSCTERNVVVQSTCANECAIAADHALSGPILRAPAPVSALLYTAPVQLSAIMITQKYNIVHETYLPVTQFCNVANQCEDFIRRDWHSALCFHIYSANIAIYISIA